jgi:hypothetical protein
LLKNPRRKTCNTLIVIALILAITLTQASPVLGLESYQRLDRVPNSDRLIQGVVEPEFPPTLPYIDSDDGLFYIVRGSQTGTVTRSLLATPSSYSVNAGTLLGPSSLSNLSTSDDIHWNVVSSPLALNAYSPTSYNLIDSTQLKAGSLSDVNVNDSQYMSFESYGQNALNFTGSYYIDAGNTASLRITGSFTIEFRIKWTSIPSVTETHNIVSKYTSSAGYRVTYSMTSAGLVTVTGRVRTSSSNYDDVSLTPFTPTIGSWYHIAFVNSNGNLHIYRDGGQHNNANGSNPASYTSTFIIGASGGTFGSTYCVDELAVWRVAKWTGSSFTVPTTAYTGAESNLAGLWHMNEGHGSTVKDSSPNSNLGTASASPVWVPGYGFAATKNLEVEFSGTSNTSPFLNSLTWTTDLGWNASSVSVTIQLFNYTLRDYPTSGEGFLAYTSSATPDVDEAKTQTITLNPNHFRNSTTGTWKIKITGKLAASHFTLNADLVKYSTLDRARTESEFVATISDVNIRTGISKLNVTVEVKSNLTSVIQSLYLYNYTKNAYVLRSSFVAGMTDVISSINITSGAASYISPTGEMRVKLNSSWSEIYITGIDLVQWTLRYEEPKWEVQWRVDYRTTTPKADITKLSVKTKANLSRTADAAYLSFYDYSGGSWTPTVDANYSSIQTRWYNTTELSDISRFIRMDGYLNITMYAFDTNWTTIRSYTDLLAVYVGSSAPDTSPPARIIDLAPSGATPNSITLTWTATGDDLGYGTALGYVLKYSTLGPITNSTWDSSATFPQTWTPLPAGRLETYTVTGLESGTQYWFALKTYDENMNNSTISNTPNAYTVDITPPAPITDLIASNSTANSIILTWTATGDDDYSGTVTGYEVKYTTSGQITQLNWDSATTYTQSWTPLTTGSGEVHIISGLDPSTQYWFAVKAYDETPNLGGISNSPTETTKAASGGNSEGEPFNIALIIIPVAFGGLAVGALGVRVAKGRSGKSEKSPFKKRTKLPERVSPPKLREYVGESGVIPQPPRKAKFEDEERNSSRQKEEGETAS